MHISLNMLAMGVKVQLAWVSKPQLMVDKPHVHAMYQDNESWHKKGGHSQMASICRRCYCLLSAQ